MSISAFGTTTFYFVCPILLEKRSDKCISDESNWARNVSTKLLLLETCVYTPLIPENKLVLFLWNIL